MLSAALDANTITIARQDPGTEAGKQHALPEMMTVVELAALLRVSKNTIYAALKKKLIPGVVRIGTSIRISRVTVLNWCCQGHALRSGRQS